jgi:hypothetical protein
MNVPTPLRVAIAVLAVCLVAASALGRAGESTRRSPGYSLEIRLPQDVIRADQEVPLEVTLTNTSDKPMSYGLAFGPPVWTYVARLVVRDSEGNLLQQKPLVRRFSGLPAGGPPRRELAAGQKLNVEILLNRVYDLSKPGKYTIQAESGRDERMVKSNIITANLPGYGPLANAAEPPFSIVLTALYSAVKSGYQIPVKIVVTNTSPTAIALRTWQEDTGVGAGVGHEFSSGILVYDGQGNRLPTTKAAQALDDGTDFPSGRFTFISLQPGEVLEETKIVGKLCDIRQPGTYRFQVVMFDPKMNLTVKSNTTTVSVLGADSAIQVATQPPFLLDIRPSKIWSRLDNTWEDSVMLAITNRSDHTIDFDIGAGDNDIDVYDRRGELAQLTENGRGCRGRLRTAARGGSPIQRLQPGETKSGGELPLYDFYDLNRSGRYTIQLRAFDDESKAIVASNKLTLEVNN